MLENAAPSRLAPQHGLAGRSQRTEIGRAGNFRAKSLHQRRIARIAVDGENGLGGGNGRAVTGRGLDVRPDNRTACYDEMVDAVAERERDGPSLDGCQQVVDEILAATRARRMQACDAVADVLVSGDQRQAHTDAIAQPFHGGCGLFGKSLHKFRAIRIAGNAHKICDQTRRAVLDAGRALIARPRAGNRARRKRRVAARGGALFDDCHRCPGVVCGDCRREPAGAGTDDENVDVLAHGSVSRSPGRCHGRQRSLTQLGWATIASRSSAQRQREAASPASRAAIAG